MKLFSRKTEPDTPSPTDVEVIRAKIAACDVAIIEAEAEFQRVSLAAALSDDDNAAKQAIATLNELRTRKDLLSNALRSALDAEKEAVGRLSEREFIARKRALSQHLGRFQRDQDAVTAALTDLRDGFRRMAATGQAITALLPPAMRGEAGFEHLLSAGHLRDLCGLEITRLSDGGIAAPGARALALARNDDGSITPMTHTINEFACGIRTAFERFGPVQPIPKQPREMVEETANV